MSQSALSFFGHLIAAEALCVVPLWGLSWEVAFFAGFAILGVIELVHGLWDDILGALK